MECFVSIKAGNGGGIARVSNNFEASVWDYPVTIAAVADILNYEILDSCPDLTSIEIPGEFSIQSECRKFKLDQDYGELLATLSTFHLPIIFIPENRWMKSMLFTEETDLDSRSLIMASRLFPELIRGTEDLGKARALLLAQYTLEHHYCG